MILANQDGPGSPRRTTHIYESCRQISTRFGQYLHGCFTGLNVHPGQKLLFQQVQEGLAGQGRRWISISWTPCPRARSSTCDFLPRFSRVYPETWISCRFFLQPCIPEAESITMPAENPGHSPCLVAENNEVAGEWIEFQLVGYQPCTYR